jgi:branched-chain amino acid transport system ATP-binding protein
MAGAFCRIRNPREAQNYAREIAKITGLDAMLELLPSEVPLAVQKRIALAQALATQPRLLMLDECASGLNPQETNEFRDILLKIYNEKKLALFVIEHVMEFVMKIADRIVVLASGKKIAEGTPKEVAGNRRVIEAYLGEKYAKYASSS